MSTERTPDTTTSPSVPTTTTPDAVAVAPACGCWSRRESLLVAGVAVAGTAGLTACGSGGAEGVASAASAASSVASAAAGAIKAAEIPVGGGKVFDALKVVVTQPTAGDFKAFSAVCTHQGCTVNNVSNGVIMCPCHGSQYDIATGAVKQGPATKPLPAKSVTVGTDGITVT
jgi:Rieske Fe-S protein